MATIEKKDLEGKVGNEKALKHLGFVRIAAIQTLVCVSNLYEYAKQNSGPLRSTVGTVEGAVTTVVGPVYEKFKGMPDDLLAFLDTKVDEATGKFNKHAPPLAKQVASQGHSLIQTTLEKGQKFVKEAQTGGPRSAIHYAATESKQLVFNQSVKLWVVLDQYHPIHKVAEKAAPTAAHLSEKYNHTIRDLTVKGYTIFGYLPLVPVDDISKAVEQGKAGKKGDAAVHVEHKSDSDSD
ncbi:putative rubber elongation factor [Rosa chinensis]|uniref:Putative rubber elongation factor n=1 Tax=Rosa chinensis TaxID=74649 RepID=A0A2P6R0D4_ROSCH|nr:REF/SRPP-like protein At1g67360 [Rosa chinensis]PRQ39901.1 putative rubber elongation factor [Rosa chinensis]